MKNPLKKTIEKRPWLKFLSNRYVLILLLFISWMLFLDNYSYLDHRVLNKQIDELEENKKYYQDEISKDHQNIKLLKNPDQIEKYAREKYYMKKDSEDIYIIEFEGDTTNGIQ
ncbi:septum formation initiator family protein [Flavobacterium sp. GT3R68]|uniref:FtsB family cell division protein n=1 Tax=Flavobacterium sp. GT3R68 TaxID=2594437 RepID=UPI000F873DC9|nr:septum formation initiator family protein [Flavobacterium sp. GT3R68]RTY93416.1 septum formation initiator family protein [Flavobacterium sp. GSN2]TRW92411.1 septum formation initiator family protein [Flavobacterium sp. GT3R68]